MAVEHGGKAGGSLSLRLLKSDRLTPELLPLLESGYVSKYPPPTEELLSLRGGGEGEGAIGVVRSISKIGEASALPSDFRCCN